MTVHTSKLSRGEHPLIRNSPFHTYYLDPKNKSYEGEILNPSFIVIVRNLDTGQTDLMDKSTHKELMNSINEVSKKKYNRRMKLGVPINTLPEHLMNNINSIYTIKQVTPKVAAQKPKPKPTLQMQPSFFDWLASLFRPKPMGNEYGSTNTDYQENNSGLYR